MPAAFPEGISGDHLQTHRARAHLNWLPLLVLGAFLAGALFGLFGGQPNATRTQASEAAVLRLEGPEVLRNGEFFEMKISVEARQAIAKPVIAIPLSYWRMLTINTLEPGPAAEKSEGDTLLLEYDPLEAGGSFAVKIDGQSNPTLNGGTHGEIELRDGDRPLATLPVRIRVLP